LTSALNKAAENQVVFRGSLSQIFFNPEKDSSPKILFFGFDTKGKTL